MHYSSVIIADDDYLVIDDLKNSIQWNELGYEVVGTATNGTDALQLICAHAPDLLITDIIMPSMTGLEVIEEARKSFPDMQILIISSYDEFEYAKTAIAHGVADYLLKTQITPLSFSQRLIELSHSASAKKRRNQAALQQSLRDYFNRRSAGGAREREDSVLSSISQLRCDFIVIAVHSPFVAEKERFDRIVYENAVEADAMIAAKFTDSSIPIRFVYGSFLILGFVSTQEPRRSSSGIQSIILKLRSILDTSLSRPSRLFCTANPCTLAEFRELFFRLQDVMLFEAAFCANTIQTTQELSRMVSIPSRKDFPFAGFHWDSREISADLDRLEQYLQKRIDCHDIHALHHLVYLLSGWLRAGDGAASPAGDGCHYFSDPQMLITHIRALILGYVNSSGPDAGEDQPVVVKSALEYIQAHFSDHEITVQSISDAVNVSAGRLGVLFRQSLGKSINEALTDARIEHAIFLLQNTSLKIYEVADQSGFNAPHYFSDIMYKKTGKRPIDYKRLPVRE